jgi:hypothetical protein
MYPQLRSLTLPGADSTPTLASLTDRFVAAGVKGPCGALSIKQIRDDVIPVEELERYSRAGSLRFHHTRVFPHPELTLCHHSMLYLACAYSTGTRAGSPRLNRLTRSKSSTSSSNTMPSRGPT